MKYPLIGVLLSILIPGFGILRAGKPKRAIIWFLFLLASSLIAVTCLALSVVPLWAGATLMVLSVIAGLAMLFDSYRPGKMTKPLWALFAGLFILFNLLPELTENIVETFEISSGAMAPTFIGKADEQTPDKVIVDKLSYHFSSPKRGDLVVFNTSQISKIRQFTGQPQSDVFYVKRLIGLPGEKISIIDGKVYADGQRLTEADGIPSNIKYVSPGIQPNAKHQIPSEFAVNADEYFVLGDNSSNSLDSRYWGGVPKLSISGKVTAIYHPFGRAGRL